METQEFRLKHIKQEIIDLDKAKGIVTTYINTFNIVDDYNEVSMPGSFKKTFKENLNKIYWLYNHDWDEMPGITLKLYEDAKGAIAVGQINMKKQLGMDVWSDYILFAENGRSLEHSVRVQPIKYTIVDETMYIQEQKLREWSTLTRPGANAETEVISLKQSEDEIKLLRAALKLDYSDERLKQFEEKLNSIETLMREAVKNTSQIKPDRTEIINSLNKLNQLFN